MWTLQRFAAATGRCGGVDRSGDFGAAVWGKHGECAGVSMEENDWAARETAAVSGYLVSILEQRVGDFGFSQPVRGGGISFDSGFQYRRDAGGHGGFCR